MSKKITVINNPKSMVSIAVPLVGLPFLVVFGLGILIKEGQSVPFHGTSLTTSQAGSILEVLAVVFVIFMVWKIYGPFKAMNDFLKKRSEGLQAIARQHTILSESEVSAKIGEPSLKALAWGKLFNYKDSFETKDWLFTDFTFKITNTKNYGPIFAYSIMAATLPRIMPNVLFDSLKGQGRQFDLDLLGLQPWKFEGDFSSYFDLYIPKGYTIDTLSFITPEVMEALISASEYDIEIKDDKLYLYGPFTKADYQIADMSEKLAIVKLKLQHNIVTYKDDRLKDGTGRKTVTDKARKLELSTIDPVSKQQDG